MHICMIRIHTRKRARHSTCVYIPVDDGGLQIAKLLRKEKKKKIMKKERRRRERDG